MKIGVLHAAGKLGWIYTPEIQLQIVGVRQTMGSLSV